MEKFLHRPHLAGIQWRSALSRAIAAMIFALALTVVNGQSILLKDVNETADIDVVEFAYLTPGSGKVFFVNNFNELWKTTGNVGGTVKLKGFKSISGLKNIGETLYFSADDGSGAELWKSAGTFASTVKVKDIVPGTMGSGPRMITAGDGVFYFVANTPAHGAELWKSDGTSSGTTLVKDIQPGKRGSDPKELTFINGALYFSANDGKVGHELWKSDGTPQGTVLVKDMRTGAYLGSMPEQLTKVSDRLFFTAYEPAGGRELWMSDGTMPGTVLAADIRPGTGSPDIQNLTAVNNTLFFSANDGIHGHELWKSNGLQTSLVKDLTPGRAGSHGQQVFTHPMGNFTNVSGYLFFTAYESSTYYIWRSDGTYEGTKPLEIADHGIMHPEPRFVAMGTSVYYFNSPNLGGCDYDLELRKMRIDGFGSVLIAELVQVDFYSRYSPHMVTLNNSLYFWGRDSMEGYKLFRSNGTTGSMIFLNDSYKPTLSSSPSDMINFKGAIIFAAEDEPYSPSIWKTDGTPTGTIKLHDAGAFDQTEIVATREYVYFISGGLLWKTDGTQEGTVRLTFDQFLYVSHLTAVGDIVFFTSFEKGLWRTDGTEAGTFQVSTEGNAFPFDQPLGDLLFFKMFNEQGQFELWRSNGQPSGTFRIYSFPGLITYYTPSIADANALYFVAHDGLTGSEVWRSDGTAPGTYRISNFRIDDDYPNSSFGPDIFSMEVWKGNVYISAMDDTQTWALYRYDGRNMARVKDVNMITTMIPTENRLHLFPRISDELYYMSNHWVTDGTTEGTELINESGLHNGYPIDHVVFNDVLYFAGYTRYLWRSDGTVCGTFPIEQGVDAINVLERNDNTLVFGGHTASYGMEPYAFDLRQAPASPCGVPSFANATGNLIDDSNAPVAITSYPNPFTEEFLLTVPGEETDVIGVEVFTHTGYPVETVNGISANAEQRLGASWKSGQYILRVNISGNIISEHVVKK